MASLSIRDRKLAERLSKMTPEELEQYEARRKSNRPGTTAERESARYDRKAKKLIADLRKTIGQAPRL